MCGCVRNSFLIRFEFSKVLPPHIRATHWARTSLRRANGDRRMIIIIFRLSYSVRDSFKPTTKQSSATHSPIYLFMNRKGSTRRTAYVDLFRINCSNTHAQRELAFASLIQRSSSSSFVHIFMKLFNNMVDCCSEAPCVCVPVSDERILSAALFFWLWVV